jgi:hypothetical protein
MKRRTEFLTLIQTFFLASMITGDFAYGMIVKSILAPTHLLQLIRLDMLVPVVLMLVTRRMIDRFGVLCLYESVWGLFSAFAMPAAFGLPGVTKLIPSILQGLFLDSMMSLFRTYDKLRFITTAIAGALFSSLAYFTIQLALGMPWSHIVRLLFGLQLLTNLIIWLLGGLLALIVWKKIKDTQIARRIAFVPND